MTRAEKIEAAAGRLVELLRYHPGAKETDAYAETVRAALALPPSASPGPEPRAMEEIERLLSVYAYKCGDPMALTTSRCESRDAILAAIRRALGAASVSDSAECAGAFQRGVEAAAEVLRGVVDSSEEDDRWDAIVAEAESQILDLAHRRPTRSSPGSASPGERRELGGEAKDYRTLAFRVRILATSKPPGLPRGKSDLWATWDREFDALSAAETPPAPAAPPESSGAEKEES